MQAKWAAEKAARVEHSEYESSEEEADEEATDGRSKQLAKERLLAVKELLFDLFRVPTGEDKLCVPDFINALIEQKRETGNVEKFG